MTDSNSFNSGKQSSSSRERLKQKKSDTFKLWDKKTSLTWYKKNIKRARRQGKKPSLDELEIVSQHPELSFSKIQKRKFILE